MSDKIHANWIAATVPTWEEIKPHTLERYVIDKQAAEIDRLTKQCNDFAQEAFKTRIESETLEQHYKCEIDRLRTLITKLHAAKVRFHTQLAACDLFDAIGLKNERPVK